MTASQSTQHEGGFKVGDRVRLDSRCDPVLRGHIWTVHELRPDGKLDCRSETCPDPRGKHGVWAEPQILQAAEPLPASPATPPDVAAPGDRLFETGCAFCAADTEHHRCDAPKYEYRYCDECLVRHEGGPGRGSVHMDAEYDRRRALQTPPAPEKWEARVGDRVEWDYDHGAKSARGVIHDIRQGQTYVIVDGEKTVGVLMPESVRTLRPIPVAQPATAPKGEGERKADPYWRTDPSEVLDGYKLTAKANESRRDERIAALSTGDELSQLAARRQRQRGALLEAMDDGKARREAVRGKHDWDPEDAQPLTVS